MSAHDHAAHGGPTALRALALVCLLAACSSYSKVDGVSIRSGSDEQRSAVAEAVKRTQQVWSDPQFWQLVEQRIWLPGPEEPYIRGAQVRAELAKHEPGEQPYRIVRFFSWRLWTLIHTKSNAEAGACGPVHLLRRRVLSLPLVNTVAHENTHNADVRGDCTTRFTDEGYTELDVPWLVSYGIGDLAYCHAKSQGSVDRTTTCFEEMVHGKPTCRAFARCCALPERGPTPAHIEAIRSAAVECAPGCSAIRAACHVAP